MKEAMKAALRLFLVFVVALSLVEASSDDDETYYHQFEVCDDSVILVEELSIVCDSPGTYYYGSGKYRNSASCQAGDKAKLEVVLLITQELEYGQAYLTLEASGYGSVSDVTLHSGEELCSVSSLYSKNGASCPEPGYYAISEHFYWGEQSDNYEYTFNPKVSVGLNSNPNKQVYDLGGANTNYCAGDSFSNWTKGVRESAANTIRSFFATFGILVMAVLGVLLVGWYVMRQASPRQTELIIEEPVDHLQYQKMAMMGKNLVEPV